MTLFENPEVALLLEEAAIVFSRNSNATTLIEQAHNSVVLWKFASDEFYNPIPLQSEINKMKKGKIIEVESSQPLYNTHIYSFGFDLNNKLIIAHYLTGKDESTGVNSKVYMYNADDLKYFNIRYYPKGNFPDKLISCGIFKKIESLLKLDVLVSNLKNKSATMIYYKSSEVIERIEKFATGWNGSTEYIPLYDDKGIKEITVGNTVWWKRTGKA